MHSVKFLILGVVLTIMVFTTTVHGDHAASIKIKKSGHPMGSASILTAETPTATRCGDNYNTGTGSVFYKPFEEVLENERCNWIIAVPFAVGYTVNIQYLGDPTNQQGSGQELTITGIRNGGENSSTSHPPVFTEYQPTSTGFFTVTDSNIVLITFHSLSSEESNANRAGTGFSLRYEGILTGNISASANASTQHIFDSSFFEWRYPTDDKNKYADMEVAAFVFSPTNNLYCGKGNHIWYKQIYLESECKDALYVYKYNATDKSEDLGRWRFEERICMHDRLIHIQYDDLALIIFQSDESYTEQGFWLYSATCQC